MGKIAKLAVLVLMSCAPTLGQAELQPEELTKEELSDVMQPHWVWINDVSFDRTTDGRAYLIDADSAQMLGMVSGGYSHGVLMLAPDGKSFAVPATYLSRGTHGDRTDVATFYKTRDLAPGAEAILPAKRYSGIPFISISPVMPDGRFGLIYNFTPEQSVSVIDMVQQKTVGEFLTSGCGLIFPTGPRTFFLVCSDGALQTASLDEDGKVSLGATTKQLFAVDDPVTEKGVWTGHRWLFFTPKGKVHVIEQKDKLPQLVRTWSLLGKNDAGWLPGALQTAAYHRSSGRLYVLMHQGGPHSHKDPGTELWVYDAATGQRTQRIALDGMASSVAISQDDKPLLYTTMFGDSDFKIYDAATGKLLRKVTGLGTSLSVIQPAPSAL